MGVSRMLRLLCINEFPKMPVVKSTWLSLCLRKTFKDFQLQNISTASVQSKVIVTESRRTEAKDIVLPSSPPALNEHQLCSKTDQVGNTSFMTDSSSDSEHESSDDAISNRFSEPTNSVSIVTKRSTPKQISIDKFVCAQSSKNPSPIYNRKITEKLEEVKFLPNIGESIKGDIWEIIQTGELTKLKEFEANEEVKTLKLFTNVCWIGPECAQRLYQQGFRTISDLKEKASLTHNQQVGVRLYDDLLDRMPREEAGEIERVVKEAAESLQDGIIAQACGSYRRGKPTCGDVDVLITHPDGKSHEGIFHKLLGKLKESGFLTDDLLVCCNQKKYLGVCKLPGENRKHRRLDIIFVPYKEYGCALVYFTGSAHFNRSLRLLCTKKNMSLNEHTLKTVVVRKGHKIIEATIIPTPTEESVFQVLKIPFRPPEERDH